MSARMTLRRTWDKVFTGLAGGSVAVLSLVLLIVLVPMLGRGCTAVFFTETVEFREMEFTELGRGDEQALKAEVARVARFLVSPAAAYVTGEIVCVNGGFNA